MIFADSTDWSDPGVPVRYYRAAGFTGLTVKLAVPEGRYDNADGNNKAIMMAGRRDTSTGECTLLATGVIVAHSGGPQDAAAAQIGPGTSRVMFSLTALTAEIKAAPDGAFGMDDLNYGITTIHNKPHPFFRIAPGTIANPEITTADFRLFGWENGAGNNTQRFIHLIHNPEDVFGLTGIGVDSTEGDSSLDPSAATWRITNQGGTMHDGDPINIEFTSRSTVSGMGWMAVHVPVKAFENTTGIQVWYLGSGLDFDKFNSGAGTKGAGIVILNGNTTGSFLEYILDLDDVRNPNPVNAAGVWDFQNDVFTLLGDAGATVRVIGDTVVRRIQVKDGADVTVLLDGMSIITPAGGSPFALGNGSKATLHLADGTINNLTASSTYAGLQANEGIAGLVIEGSNGELRATTSGYNSTGIGGANAAGGAITINGGVVNALGGESGAGIGGGGIAAGGAITINGGVITATGNFGGSGIGGGSGWGGGSTSSIRGGSITINGGLITAIGGSYGRGGGAGIGGGGGMDFGGDGGTIHITGGVVYAKSVMGTGIGGGSPNTAVPGKSGDITIDGGIVIAEGGKGAGIGGGHGGSGGHSHNSYNGDGQNITITDSTVIAKGGVGENYGSAGIGGGVGMTGYGGAGGTIQITNAVVIAEGGNGANGNGAGIGSGSGSYGGGNGGTITLSGGTIYAKSYGTAESIGMATNGSSASISKTNSPIIFAEVGNANIVNDPTNGILVGSGNVDLSGLIGGSFPNFNHGVITLSNLTILAGATLTVPPFMSFNQGGSGITLTNNGAIVNNGTIAIGSGNSLIYNSGIVKNYGTVNTSGGTLNPTHPPGPAHIKKAQVVI